MNAIQVQAKSSNCHIHLCIDVAIFASALVAAAAALLATPARSEPTRALPQQYEVYNQILTYALTKPHQNHRSCDASTGMCINAIFWDEGGSVRELTSTTDLEDRWVSYHYCEFNQARDVQHCTNIETGARSTLVTGSDGKMKLTPDSVW
jgi:hypothetical protein